MSSSTPPATESLPGTSTSDDSPMYSPNDFDDEESLANIAVALYNPTWNPDQLTFSQVRDTVFSTYFCGFEKEAVMSWADDIERNFQDFKIVMLKLQAYNQSLERIMEILEDPDQEPAYRDMLVGELTAAIDRSDAFWGIIYDLRKTLLTPPTPESESVEHPMAYLETHIACLARTTLEMSRKRLTCAHEHGAPHMCQWHGFIREEASTPGGVKLLICLLLVWRNARTEQAWNLAFDEFGAIIHTPFAREPFKQFVEFLEFKTDDDSSAEIFAECMHRDFMNEGIVDAPLRELMDMCASVRTHTPYDSYTRYDREIFPSLLAACRRQLCQGTPEEDADFDDRCLILFFGSTIGQMVATGAPEQYMHDAIALVAKAAVTSAAPGRQNDAKCLGQCTKFIDLIIQSFIRIASLSKNTPHPDLVALRAHTLDLCGKTANALRIFNKHDARGMWLDLQARIKKLQGASKQPEQEKDTLPMISRCAWKNCLCNVYQPAHAMKVCTRCRMVAYCSTKCQKNDWVSHRTWCGAE